MKIVRLEEPLPCGVYGCNRPARVVVADPDPTQPGRWTMMPVCRDCAVSTAGLYGLSSDGQQERQKGEER